MANTTVPVTRRALIQRLNRRLSEDHQVLKKSREGFVRSNLGEYYILNLDLNQVDAMHVDPEILAKKLKVLAPWEIIID
jgi:hypothetical protein